MSATPEPSVHRADLSRQVIEAVTTRRPITILGEVYEPRREAALAKGYQIRPDRGILIDGQLVPWFTAAHDTTFQPLALVEPLNECAHILWVPVLIDGPIPPLGHPTGGEVAEVVPE